MKNLRLNILRWLLLKHNSRCLKEQLFTGSLKLPGLTRAVSVFQDRWLVPHIQADTLADAFRAQGFVHARDRLWQLEIQRRSAQGLLAEMLGSVALETDQLTRTLGFNRLAKRDWKILDGSAQELLTAYSEGVNTYLETENYPAEFKLLKHIPEPWSPLDSLAWAHLMGWTLSHGWSGSLTRWELIQKVGEQKATELGLHYPDNHPVELPYGMEFNELTDEGLYKAVAGPFLDKDLEGGGRGSNAWAVWGRRTETGKPLLCNDTHLALRTPSPYYMVHIKTDAGYHVSGLSLAGVPGILLGHNQDLAWGITLSYIDTEDLFLEKMDPANPGHYLHREKSIPLKTIIEVIPVKDGVDHDEPVQLTAHGPIISNLGYSAGQPLSLCSMSLQPTLMWQGFLELGDTHNWDSFLSAIRLVDMPSLNFVYADTAGNIGLAVSGRVPVRGKGNGQVPVPGWSGEYDWIDEIPVDKMPSALNPGNGIIISANHRIVDDNYPYDLGHSFMNGYRARRIAEMLNENAVVTVEFCAIMQRDLVSIPGRELVKGLIKGLHTARPKAQKVIDILQDWDGILAVDSCAGSVYEVLIYQLLRRVLLENLGEELTVKVLGKGPHPVLLPTNEYLGHAVPMLFRMLQNPDSEWITSEKEVFTILDLALVDTCTWLEDELGFEPKQWQWGRLHQLVFRHALSVRKPLDKLFNVGPFPIGGDTDTVFQTAYNPDAPYAPASWSPAHRMIIDLSNWCNCHFIIAPGQSGVLGSPHYDGLVNQWLKGELIPMLWDAEDISRECGDPLMLKPE